MVLLLNTNSVAVAKLAVAKLVCTCLHYEWSILLPTHYMYLQKETPTFTYIFCILFTIFGIGLIIIDSSFEGNIYGFFISILGLLLMIIFIYFSGKLANLTGSAIMNFHINLWSSLILGFLIFSTEQK